MNYLIIPRFVKRDQFVIIGNSSASFLDQSEELLYYHLYQKFIIHYQYFQQCSTFMLKGQFSNFRLNELLESNDSFTVTNQDDLEFLYLSNESYQANLAARTKKFSDQLATRFSPAYHSNHALNVMDKPIKAEISIPVDIMKNVLDFNSWQAKQIKSDTAAPLMLLTVDKENSCLFHELAYETFKSLHWLQDLIQFFIDCTNHDIMVGVPLRLSDFLYSAESGIKGFCQYHLLYPAHRTSRELVEQHNIQMLIASLSQMINNEIQLSSQGGQYIDVGWINSPFMKQLLGQLPTGKYQYLRTILQDVQQQKVTGDEQSRDRMKIGVFLDAANFSTYYDMFSIDFNSILVELFGNYIESKVLKRYGVMFEPTWDDEQKMRTAMQRMQEHKQRLEAQGFHIDIVGNDTSKAKQWLNEVERDVDDERLIEEMEKLLHHQFTHVVLFTGDKHFIPIMQRYKENGVKCVVIGFGEKSMSSRWKELFETYTLSDFYQTVKI